MKQIIVPEILYKIKNDVLLLLKFIRAAELCDFKTNHENYTELISEASMRSEEISCKIRHLIYKSTDVKKQYWLSKIAEEVQGIRISTNEFGSVITLPILIDKKKVRGEFLREPLFNEFKRYSDNNEVKKLSKATICFQHIYCRQSIKSRVRDYDNLETKQILDVISTFLLDDDSGGLCDIYHFSEAAEVEKTKIFIMNSERFLEWYSCEKQCPKN